MIDALCFKSSNTNLVW